MIVSFYPRLLRTRILRHISGAKFPVALRPLLWEMPRPHSLTWANLGRWQWGIASLWTHQTSQCLTGQILVTVLDTCKWRHLWSWHISEDTLQNCTIHLDGALPGQVPGIGWLSPLWLLSFLLSMSLILAFAYGRLCGWIFFLWQSPTCIILLFAFFLHDGGANDSSSTLPFLSTFCNISVKLFTWACDKVGLGTRLKFCILGLMGNGTFFFFDFIVHYLFISCFIFFFPIGSILSLTLIPDMILIPKFTWWALSFNLMMWTEVGPPCFLTSGRRLVMWGCICLLIIGDKDAFNWYNTCGTL